MRRPNFTDIQALTSIRPNQAVIYYEGIPLATARTLEHEAHQVGNMAMAMCTAGEVDLVQRRLGEDRYSYIAVGREQRPPRQTG